MKTVDVSESIFIRSLRCQPVERTPVWIMRQAGRYLPEYQKTRAQAGHFLNLCKNKELACEVTLQPLRRFELDAAILFSDILTIPDAMGLGLSFVEGEGPRFDYPVRDQKAIDALPMPSPHHELKYVMDAVALIRQEMPAHLPLIGFAGSPWTLACYMIEGASSRDFKHATHLMYQSPELMHQLLAHLTKAVVAYLDAQALAGANAVMVFDTWGGTLTTPGYQKFSLRYLADIVRQFKILHPDVPVILFTKGGGQWLKEQAQTGCEALGVDWTCDLAAARRVVGAGVALQGNLDPRILLTSPACIRTHVQEVLASYGVGEGHIFNLGHGITPDVPPEHVAVMIDAIRARSPEYHVILNSR